MTGRQRLLVAVLLRGTVADEVNALRRVLRSTELDRIAPHITLVAPMNVADGDVDPFCLAIETVAAKIPPIICELDGVATFPPHHHVIYLNVEGELRELRTLRDRCSEIDQRSDTRPFVPHVTLKSHATSELVAHARALMARFVLPLPIDRVSVLRLDESSPERTWRRLDEVALGSLVTFGRGGREVALTRATMMGPEDRMFRAAHHGAVLAGPVLPDAIEPGAMAPTEQVVIRARLGGRLVGLLVARLHGAFCVIEYLAVGEEDTDSGVGRQLVRYLERCSEELEIRELIVACEGVAEGFFRAVGFVPCPPIVPGSTSNCLVRGTGG